MQNDASTAGGILKGDDARQQAGLKWRPSADQLKQLLLEAAKAPLVPVTGTNGTGMLRPPQACADTQGTNAGFNCSKPLQ